MTRKLKGGPSGSGPPQRPAGRHPRTWPQAVHRHSCPQAPSPLCFVSNLEGGGLDSLRSRRLAGHLAPFGTAALDPSPPLHRPSPLSNTSCPPSSPGQKTRRRHQIPRRNSPGATCLPHVLLSSRCLCPCASSGPTICLLPFIPSPAPFHHLFMRYICFLKPLFIGCLGL